MTSFRSKKFPTNRNRFFIQQENAMQYYAAFTLVVMLAVMVKVGTGGGSRLFFFGAVVVELLAMGLANMLSFAKLRRTYAQIFFVEDHFSLISVYDILYEEEHKVFPLRYANPQRYEDTITFHFNDMIVTLHRKDWDDFDLIWLRLTSQSAPTPSGWQTSIS